MIRTKLTALMYAGALVSILLILLTGIVYIVVTWPVFCIIIATVVLLCIYYKSIYKELKSRKERKL